MNVTCNDLLFFGPSAKSPRTGGVCVRDRGETGRQRQRERKRVRGVTGLGGGGSGGFSKDDWRLNAWISTAGLPWFLHFLQEMIVAPRRYTSKEILVCSLERNCLPTQ